MKRWYAVHTRVRGEGLALINLGRQGLEAYLPRYSKRRRHARRTDWVAAPMFPRYLFVHMDVTATPWRAIHSTIGVSHLLCHGDTPIPVPLGVIEEIIEREDRGGLVVMNQSLSFKRGDAVRIVAGAFCDQVGMFVTADDDQRVVILLAMLGRKMNVRLPAESVAAHA